MVIRKELKSPNGNNGRPNKGKLSSLAKENVTKYVFAFVPLTPEKKREVAVENTQNVAETVTNIKLKETVGLSLVKKSIRQWTIPLSTHIWSWNQVMVSQLPTDEFHTKWQLKKGIQHGRKNTQTKFVRI